MGSYLPPEPDSGLSLRTDRGKLTCRASRGGGTSGTLRPHSWAHRRLPETHSLPLPPSPRDFSNARSSRAAARPTRVRAHPANVSRAWPDRVNTVGSQEEMPMAPPSCSCQVNRVRVTSRAPGSRPRRARLCPPSTGRALGVRLLRRLTLSVWRRSPAS